MLRRSLTKGMSILWVATLLGACQTGVLISPGRTGELVQPPDLGRTLDNGDPVRCDELRVQLTQLITAMKESLRDLHRFTTSYGHAIEQLQAFDAEWRTGLLAHKNELYAMPSCEDFVVEWTLALATWRDLFRYEKETVSALRSDKSIALLEPSGKQVEDSLVHLQNELRQ